MGLAHVLKPYNRSLNERDQPTDSSGGSLSWPTGLGMYQARSSPSVRAHVRKSRSWVELRGSFTKQKATRERFHGGGCLLRVSPKQTLPANGNTHASAIHMITMIAI